MKNSIAIFGASGLIGTSIIKSSLFSDYNFNVFSRNIGTAKNIFEGQTNIKLINYNPDSSSEINELNDCSVIINLSGASIAGKRWSKNYKKMLYNSRILTTRNIVNSILNSGLSPQVFINASAIGYYGYRDDESINEVTGPGNDFLAILCRDWENETSILSNHNIRTINLRIGIVLTNKDGILKKLSVPIKFFVGGYQGNGKQWISWIHIDDLISLIHFAVLNSEIDGPFNCTSPNPVRNKEFNKILASELNRPSFIPVPSFILKLALGELAESIINGQKVIPEKALKHNFEFQFDDLRIAIANLLLK